jgi:hypothetical protein
MPAPVEMIDKTSRAYLCLEAASIRISGPVATARAKRDIAHQCLSE